VKWLFLLLFPFLSLSSSEKRHPGDQFAVIFGSSGYILYKALDFASDHGFRYIKILSYEFNAFGFTSTGHWTEESKEGKLFVLRDEHATLSFLCFEKKPHDFYIIDVEKYRPLLEDIAASAD
jgi:hypothetical protein